MLVVTSVMFTFISFWRTAALVLCDLASTAYYIGGIVESQIGKAAPWFILAVMLFSYGVRSIYIESCAMFVRGGVYRIVKEAMGGGLARLAVSALLFDYILTGPISGVTAGQYIIGLFNDLFELGPDSPLMVHQNGLSAAIAIVVTLYFWRVNIKGIHESSDQALRIMGATTVMGVVMIVWCLVTIAVRPEARHLPPATPDLSKKVDVEGKPMLDPFGKQVDPLGFIGETSLGESLRPEHIDGNWWSLIGVIGIIMSFGHSILAMSGEETLAQVYREVESPKLKNFKRAALVVFLYSLLFTSLISFFAVMIIPDGVRMSRYSGNLIGGLAMNVVGPQWARLILNGAGRGRRLVDPLGGRQHGDRRLQRRLEPCLRGWRLARLVLEAASPVRHELAADQPGGHPPDRHDPRQPGQRADAGRSLRLRRGLELRLHVDVDAGPPLQAPGAPRVRGTAEHPGRPLRLPGGDDVDLPDAGHRGDRQPAHQGGGHDHRRRLHGGLLSPSSGSASTRIAAASGTPAEAARAPRTVQRAASRPAQRGEPEPDQAVPQAGGDPFAVQPGDARAVPGRDRSRDDRGRGDDRVGVAARARAT